MRRILLGIAFWIVSAALIAAQDFAALKDKNWHQFRGPEATGVAPHGNPPVTWDEKTNIKWKLKIPGDSTATPIIWGDQLFTTTAIKTDVAGTPDPPEREFTEGEVSRIRSTGVKPAQNVYQWVVMSLNKDTGKEIWKQTVKESVPHEGTHPDGSYAATTPITDGKHLFVNFGSRGIYCFDMNGKQQWSRDFGKMNVFSTFGEAISPVLHKDTLVILWDHETGSFITALDANTGETRWKVAHDETTSWTTPLIVEAAGKAQVITFNKKFIRSYDITNGELIWQCHGKYTACVPMPVSDGKLVFIMTGFQGYELLAIPLDVKGDITDQGKVAWEKTQGTPYCPSALLYDGELWMNQENKAILSVLNAKTGDNIINRQRLPGLNNIYASPVAAAERIYFTGRDGATVVLKKAPEVEILATNKLDDGVDASAAIVGSNLYIRGRQTMYCIGQ